MTVACARIEQCVAAEQCWRVGMRQQTNVAHRVSRRVEAFELHRLPDFDHIARTKAAVDPRDLISRIFVCEQPRTGGGNHGAITSGVIAVLVCIQDLSDIPAFTFSRFQALLMIQRIDSERFAAFGADDEIVKVPISVSGPDLFDNHDYLCGVLVVCTF